MASSSGSLHEPENRLSQLTRDLHRAIVSVMEELEAIDWYQQRVEATDDAELREILAHNRDEEKEHMAMVLEWIRRKDPMFDEVLHRYLFREGPITGLEAQAEGKSERTSGGSATGSTGNGLVGSLRGRR
jgi:ferritin-like protein